MRLRYAVSAMLAAAPLAVATPAGAAPCTTATKTISGTLIGADKRFVNAMLGFDLMRVSGGTVQHLDGREGSANYGCPGYYGYGTYLRMNTSLTAYGSTTSGTRYWSVRVPATVNQVIIEVYPRAAGTLATVDRRYSGALRWKVPIPYGKPINIKLPLMCAAGGSVGYVTGRATKNGVPVKVDFVGAWSAAKDNNTAQPIQGFRVGYGTDSGTWSVKGLVSGQPYTMIWEHKGVRRQRYMVWVNNRCKGTAVPPVVF